MTRLLGTTAVVLLILSAAAPALAHVTPPVVLVSDREAVAGLLGGARRFFVRELRLTPTEAAAIQRERGWRPEEEFYRFYIGRDEQGRLVRSVVFMTEYTIHGPVRVAVAIAPDGRLAGATIVEVTEETYGWVRPLIDRQFTNRYVGRSLREALAPLGREASGGGEMTEFYGQVVASLLQRALVLYDVAVRQGLK